MPRLAAALLALSALAACHADAPATLWKGNAVAAPVTAPALLERLGLAVRATPAGMVVIAIDLDGPAAQSGVHIGDLVVGVNGTAVTNGAELERAVSRA